MIQVEARPEEKKKKRKKTKNTHILLQRKLRQLYPFKKQQFTKSTGRHNHFRSQSERKKLEGEDKTPGPAMYNPGKAFKKSEKVWRDFSKDTGRDRGGYIQMPTSEQMLAKKEYAEQQLV